MLTRTDQYCFEWVSNDCALLSELSLKDIWINDIENEVWKYL
jgi:hypothetical protein